MAARLLFAAGVVALLAGCAAGSRDLLDDAIGRKLKIVNGKPAAQGRYPYLVGIVDRDATVPYTFCGGAIINYGTKDKPGPLSGKLLLTAAHCLDNGNKGQDGTQWVPTVVINPNYKQVYTDEKSYVGQFPIASGNYANTPVWRTVYGSYPHQSYQRLATKNPPFAPDPKMIDIMSENDIAILVLDAPVGPPQTTPTVLIPQGVTSDKKADGGGMTSPKTLRVVGLGFTDLPTKAEPTVVQEGDIPLRKWQDCQSITPPWDGTTVYPGSLTHFQNNSRFCAGAGNGGTTYKPAGVVSHCSADSGGPVLVPGTDWKTDLEVGLVSYTDKKEDPTNGNYISQCGWKPGVYTDLALMRPWIDWQIKQIEDVLFEYTMDIWIKKATMQVYQGAIPMSIQWKLGAYLTKVIGKTIPKDNFGNNIVVPTQINFYSYKADKEGRMRFKWTSKKTWEQVSNYFTTGSVDNPCDASKQASYRWPVKPNKVFTCRQGPFSTEKRPADNVGASNSYKSTNPPSYFREVLDELENIMLEGFEKDGKSNIVLKVQKILVSNGYIKPVNGVPACSGSGVNACFRSKEFPAVPA